MCKSECNDDMPEGSVRGVVQFGVTPEGMALLRAGNVEWAEALAQGVYESALAWARKQAEEQDHV